mmetsp:Transcript_6653/g.17862  ORF Transcript_6653/g.17862 Transcript_6653/m.17862 type:complete len:255 (+) Transcript_6653:91-855(+)
MSSRNWQKLKGWPSPSFLSRWATRFAAASASAPATSRRIRRISPLASWLESASGTWSWIRRRSSLLSSAPFPSSSYLSKVARSLRTSGGRKPALSRAESSRLLRYRRKNASKSSKVSPCLGSRQVSSMTCFIASGSGAAPTTASTRLPRSRACTVRVCGCRKNLKSSARCLPSACRSCRISFSISTNSTLRLPLKSISSISRRTCCSVFGIPNQRSTRPSSRASTTVLSLPACSRAKDSFRSWSSSALKPSDFL